MNLHEYQAKALLKKAGILMPPFEVIASLNELDLALENLKTDRVVLKVQIHAGGRGKVGGVKLANNRHEAYEYAKNLLGMKIINSQTGQEGILVTLILLSPIVDYEKEFYLGAIIDRRSATSVLIASPYGGVEIEEIAKSHSDAILKLRIPLDGGLRSYHLWEVAKFMGWEENIREQGMILIQQFAQEFVKLDASLLEINPLVLTKEGQLIALDAKLTIDDNSLFRHPKIAKQFDVSQLPPLEALARQYGLDYIALDGEIGCMVNGAGLAMATMDIIEFYGGRPANFLDVGGGASEEKITEGFKIILSDSRVKSILVNIFGGIMNCETLAAGIIAAIDHQGIQVPLIIRMEGTNVDKGKAIFLNSGLKIQVANSLREAAEASVRACTR